MSLKREWRYWSYACLAWSLLVYGVGDACDNCPTVPNPDQDAAACDCPCYTAAEIDEFLPAGSATHSLCSA